MTQPTTALQTVAQPTTPRRQCHGRQRPEDDDTPDNQTPDDGTDNQTTDDSVPGLVAVAAVASLLAVAFLVARRSN